MSPLLAAVANWLATFAVHATLALAVVLLLASALRRRAGALQQSLLRWAPWLAIASATAQCLWLGSPFPPSVTPTPVSAATMLVQGEPLSDLMVFAPEPPASASAWSWQAVVVVAAGVAAAVGLGWLWSVRRSLRRLLADRQPETDARILSTAAEVAHSVGLRQSPQLSRSDVLATPIAFGWLRPEICLPVRATELPDAPLRALLAHELTHLRAGDPAAMWQFALLQALFPWQPLLLLVRRRFAELVELRCDAAAAQLVSPAAVARCLVDVAGWLEPRAHAPVVALGMAGRPSALRERVEAALRPQLAVAHHRLARAVGAPALLTALTFGAPGFEAPGPEAPATVPLAALAELPPDAPFADLLAELRAERARLAAEVASLRQRLQRAGGDATLQQLHDVIQQRLSRLGAQQSRLALLLAERR